MQMWLCFTVQFVNMHLHLLLQEKNDLEEKQKWISLLNVGNVFRNFLEHIDT